MILFEVCPVVLRLIDRAREEVVPVVANCKLEDLRLCAPYIAVELLIVNAPYILFVRFNARVADTPHARELDELAIVDRKKGLPVLVLCLF